MLKLLKGAAKSDTMKFNTGVLAAVGLWFLDVVSGTNFVQSDPELLKVLLGGAALINILLRFKTKKSIAQRAGE